MISIGVDVSKGKSTVAALMPGGEILRLPFNVEHTVKDMDALCNWILSLDKEVRVVMEATGKYHLPIVVSLKEHGIYVSVVNPLKIKECTTVSNFRKVKTDKADSWKIAEYGILHWMELVEVSVDKPVYQELRSLNRQYQHYMNLHVRQRQFLDKLLDDSFPGITEVLSHDSAAFNRDKLSDFVEFWWHIDLVKRCSQAAFVRKYNAWAKKKGYHQSERKGLEIYTLAQNGIPTVSSTSSNMCASVVDAVRMLREADRTLASILAQMKELAQQTEEYEVAMEFSGIGDKLAVQLVAELGDMSKFRNKNCLIAFAGIDAPPRQSGQYHGTRRHISKRGSPILRKVGYQAMKCMKSSKNDACPVYQYILKKEHEGKPKIVAKIAGLNKFLKIYYARVMERKHVSFA